MTVQTDESERWLHFNRKTNREGSLRCDGINGDMARERQRHGDGVEDRRIANKQEMIDLNVQMGK